MAEEKYVPPEIEHGTDRDDGAQSEARAPKPCSKRMQGPGATIGYCLRPENHRGECGDAKFALPMKTVAGRAITLFDHRYGVFTEKK